MHSLLSHPSLINCRRLFLKDYEVYIIIGVHDFEKKAEQRVIFNVDLYVPLEQKIHNEIYNEACDEIIEQLRKMEDKEPELRRCLKSLVEVTKHLNLCPGVMSECEDILK